MYEASPAVPASAGKPARGPEYRVLAAKKGWPKLEGVETLYELWTTSVEKYGPRRCLGWRPKVRLLMSRGVVGERASERVERGAARKRRRRRRLAPALASSSRGPLPFSEPFALLLTFLSPRSRDLMPRPPSERKTTTKNTSISDRRRRAGLRVDDVSGGGRARRGRGIGARRSRHLAQGAHRGVWDQLSRVDDRNAGEERVEGGEEKREGEREREEEGER